MKSSSPRLWIPSDHHRWKRSSIFVQSFPVGLIKNTLAFAQGKEVKPYQKCKIYNDGSHFIAIPHTTRPAAPKRYRPEEVIEVVDDTLQQLQLNTDKCNAETAFTTLNDTNEVDSWELLERKRKSAHWRNSKAYDNTKDNAQATVRRTVWRMQKS